MTEISTRERAGEYDALETAKDGEPIFVLQGGDPHAPATVNFWAGLLRQEAMLAAKRDEAVDKFRKATNAEEVAWEMREYQRSLDDARDGRAASVDARKGYNGVEPDGDRPGIARLSALADRIYNAIAELNDAAEALGAIGGHAAAELKLRDAIVAAGEGVRLVEPRRHLPRADAQAVPA